MTSEKELLKQVSIRECVQCQTQYPDWSVMSTMICPFCRGRKMGERHGRAQALEDAAKVAESKIDPDWPGDDMSVQAEATASEIRSLKETDDG